MDKTSNIKDSTISIKGTWVSTNLAEITGAEVNGNTDNILIAKESGYLKTKKANTTGIIGSIIIGPLVEVFGSFIVAEIAEKKVFHKKKPLIEKRNNKNINAGLVNTIGKAQPLPNIEDINTNTTELKEYVTSNASDNKDKPSILPSINV